MRWQELKVGVEANPSFAKMGFPLAQMKLVLVHI